MQKIENYLHALSQLEEAAKTYSANQSDSLYRDGLIQRFEFTVELAWKSLKAYIEDQGAVVLSISSPRAVLKEAYAAGYIHDEAGWNDLITSRNLTSHVYDEQTAIDVATKIVQAYLPTLRTLAELYQ